MAEVPTEALARTNRPPVPYFINSLALSADGARIAAGTYYWSGYYGAPEPRVDARFGTYVFDHATLRQVWRQEYDGLQGVYAVAISANGEVVASGGVRDATRAHLAAYDGLTGRPLLDYAGIAPYDPAGTSAPRVHLVSLSADGRVLAAAADRIYVFLRDSADFSPSPAAILTFTDSFNATSRPTSVAVHPSGCWLAACDKLGHVCVATIDGSKVSCPVAPWLAPQVPFDRTQAGSSLGPVTLLCVATARHTDQFATGGNDYVYTFSADACLKGQGPLAVCDVWDQVPPPPPADGKPPKTPPQNVRWLAVTDDGGSVAVVLNRYRGTERIGSLVRLRGESGKLLRVWERALLCNPNSVSMDASGSIIAVADGYPIGTTGHFYCFQADGSPVWTHATPDMNWPVAVSHNGAAIAGGGDDGVVYRFARP